MNELFYGFHLILVFTFLLVCIRIGKEALFALAIFLMLLANLFVLKQIPLFQFQATTADPYVLGGLTAINVLVDNGHKQLAQKANFTILIFLGAFVVFSQLHLLYTPSSYDETQNHYLALYQVMPRLLFASLGACFVTQKFDVRLFGGLKNRFPKAPFALLNGICIIISQAIDSIVFGFLGLYGVIHSLLSVMAISYMLKIILMIFSSPLLVFTRKLCKQPL